MALQTVKLGGFVETNIQHINDNFSDLQLNKADVTSLPTKVSELENDSQFQSATQVADAITALVNTAPDTLDTLKELADALGNDPNFATTIMAKLGEKVDKVEGKGLSTEDFTTALKVKLQGLENYTLPVAGEALGGVKSGGNVTVNADGTLSAPVAENPVTKLAFTASDARWGEMANNVYTLTLASSGKNPFVLFRKEGERFGVAMAGMAVSGQNILVTSLDKFEGYLLTI